MRGSEAWVFMLRGDLTVGVIGLTTLGLAYLHISCHPLAWFLSPNAHWLVIISTVFPTLTHQCNSNLICAHTTKTKTKNKASGLIKAQISLTNDPI
jgi:hypothetical protein